MEVLSDTPFFDFGEDHLYPYPRTGLHQIEGEQPEDLRAQVRKYVPREPGVYGMLDPLGRLIYVGKSKALRNRLLSYFLPHNEEDKAGRIVQSTSAIVWETQPNEFAALLREQFLIRSFQPRFNVQGMPRRQQPIFINLGRLPAEQLYTTRKHDPNAVYAIGPLVGASRAARALEVLNRVFGLRDCSSKQPCSFTEQMQLFDIGARPGCIRLEIGSCLGPCVNGCSRNDYESAVKQAKRFLAGTNEQPVIEIQKKMDEAAANLHFEQATVLREDLRAVEWLFRRASDLAQARKRFTFVYPVAGQVGSASRRKNQTIWYLIRRGIIEGAIAAPRNDAERRDSIARVREWRESDNLVGSQYSPRPETLALVSSWFRKNRAELKNTFSPQLSKAAKPRTVATVKV